MSLVTIWLGLLTGCAQNTDKASVVDGVCPEGHLDPETETPDADCDGIPVAWDCDDADPDNACQSPAVDTLKGRWHCPEDGSSNLPNFNPIGGNFFQIIFDWNDGGWCRKLGIAEITDWNSATDFQWVLHHEKPAEEEDYHWRTHANEDGSFQWIMDLSALSTWDESFPESFSLSCDRCGPIEGPSECNAPTPPHPIDYDHPVPEEDICEPVNFTNIDD